MPFGDKRSGTRKRISRAVSKANREIKYLKQINEKLKRKLKTVQKQRQEEGKTKEPNTTRRQTETEMMEAGLTPEQRTKVRKQLLMGNSLLSEINQTKVAAGKSKQKKRILSNIVSGNILKKYRGLKWLSEKTGLNRNKMGGNLKKWFDARKRKRSKIQEQYKETIQIFLERDDNSRCQLRKADAKKNNDGVKVQTRVLTDYLIFMTSFCQKARIEIVICYVLQIKA